MNNRIEWIDQYRGLAMVFVVLSHTCVAYNWLYTYTMLPMFFFISGYLHKPKPIFSKFLKRVIFRLFIPMVIFGTLPFMLQFIKTHDYYLVLDYLKGVITGLHIGWFLPCLIVIELIVFFIDKLIDSAKMGGGIPWIVVLISFFSMFLIQEKSECPWSADTAIISIGYYYIGNILSGSVFETKLQKSRQLSAVLLVLYLALSYILVNKGYYFNISVNYISNVYIVYPMCVLACFVFYCFVRKFNIGHIFSWVGANSLFIYCTNVYFHPIATRLLGMIGIADCTTNFASGAINCILQFILMWPLIIIINKYMPFVVGKSTQTVKRSKHE